VTFDPIVFAASRSFSSGVHGFRLTIFPEYPGALFAAPVLKTTPVNVQLATGRLLQLRASSFWRPAVLAFGIMTERPKSFAAAWLRKRTTRKWPEYSTGSQTILNGTPKNRGLFGIEGGEILSLRGLQLYVDVDPVLRVPVRPPRRDHPKRDAISRGLPEIFAMSHRFVMLLNIAALTLLFSISNVSGQTKPRGPVLTPPTPTAERFAIVRLRTSAGKCVYIKPSNNLAVQKPSSCNPLDPALHFKFTSPIPGTMVLQHVDSGLCLSLNASDNSSLAGVPCLGALPISVTGPLSPGPFQQRIIVPTSGAMPPQWCLGRTAVGFGMRTYSCDANFLNLKNFSFQYV
jgi:hypothetical protein